MFRQFHSRVPRKDRRTKQDSLLTQPDYLVPQTLHAGAVLFCQGKLAPMLAWAGEGPSNQFFMSGRHGRRGSFGGGWGDEPRTRRGDIKFILLGLLSERPQHGYELIKELEARRGGFRRLSPGSVYPTLQMLEEGGYLTSEEVDGRRVYTITETGRQFLSERNQQSHSRNAHEGFTEGKPSELIELRRTLTQLNDAVTQIARSGNLEQTNRVRDLLVQVKREIYKLLAE